MESPNKKPPVGILRFAYTLFQFLFSKINKLVDAIIFSKKGSVMVSLLVSIVICIGANYEQIGMQLFNDSSTSTQIQDVQVETLYDSSKYQISGIPSTVTVQLSGDATQIQVFRRQGNMTVIADLQKLSEGTNVVDLKVQNLPTGVKAEITPSTVTVNISRKTSKEFALSSDLIVSSNRKESDYNTPVLSISDVQITGTSDQINSIRRVKAIIDGSNEQGSFETEASIVAYDAQGNTVDVNIEPNVTHVSVQLKNSDDE